jgi:hypothetical protein
MITGEMLGALALMIPIVALIIPIVGILSGVHREGMKRAERNEARKLYERIAMEKLDVMKTAVAMGFAANDLAALDQRLERLIGTSELKQLLDPKAPGAPLAPADLRQADLLDEMQQLKRYREHSEKQG